MRKIKGLKRRDFVKSITAGSLLLTGPGVWAVNSLKEEGLKSENGLVTKVKNAMLCMQRASWEQGVAGQAILELGDFDLLYLMAKEAVLRQTKEGRLSVLYSDGGATDPAASGEMVMRMAEKTGEQDLWNAHKKMLNYLLTKAPRTEDGIISHLVDKKEIWIDSMYMSPPYLCVAGEVDESIRQIKGMRKALWNGDAQLYSHRWDASKKEFINSKFWGVGNGWAMAGIARVIDDLPESKSEERDTLIEYNTENINGCLNHLRSDGLFHNVIDDETSFVETNLSQMLAYSIYRGVASGWLPSFYLDSANILRKAVHDKVNEAGFVTGVCGAPHFNSPGRATEGQAFFLLMESAYYKLI
ncbi:glycoside hydrolase family 88 protein [Marinilabilia rubra]|uniref:Glycosyl hydrolase n=1 Tax=Marinilabilia rubra TaxID=2162893 RepID=A0A2U2BAV3_9BACT|nr:glycoside hydrolase family 88 protein [Marinilabilia rubra]PWE00189.1 glycosyl hydrolase [Marinilabilia rubra]